MAPVRIAPEDLWSRLPERGRVWLHACSGESALIRAGLEQPAPPRPGLAFTGIFVPGLNTLTPVLANGARVESFFMMPEFRGHEAQVDFLPFCYRDIRRHLAAQVPDAALVMLSPPDGDGMCSLGPVTDFIADIWRRVPVLIGHINPQVPRTHGPGIPYDALSVVIEGAAPLPQSHAGSDAVSEAIAAHAAGLIANGSTIQTGLGRIPEAILRGLRGHRDLAIHSGLIGDSTLDLLEAGALRAVDPITVGVAIGSDRLYRGCARPEFRFAPPSHTHDIAVLARLPRFVTVNSATEVDLDGNAHAEMAGHRPISGPGGASDFAAGARGLDGLRIVALPATAAGGTVSRIVPPGAGAGPVSLGRFDTDVVITEFGLADLRGAGPETRRRRLAAIAAPRHRDALIPRIP